MDAQQRTLIGAGGDEAVAHAPVLPGQAFADRVGIGFVLIGASDRAPGATVVVAALPVDDRAIASSGCRVTCGADLEARGAARQNHVEAGGQAGHHVELGRRSHHRERWVVRLTQPKHSASRCVTVVQGHARARAARSHGEVVRGSRRERACHRATAQRHAGTARRPGAEVGTAAARLDDQLVGAAAGR